MNGCKSGSDLCFSNVNVTRLANSLHIHFHQRSHLLNIQQRASGSPAQPISRMTEALGLLRESDAGPSSAPITRDPSPSRDSARPLRRPASHGRLSRLMESGRSRSGSSASRAETVVSTFADEAGPSSGRVTPEQRRRSSRGRSPMRLS